MLEVRGEWSDWFEMMGKQQKQPTNSQDRQKIISKRITINPWIRSATAEAHTSVTTLRKLRLQFAWKPWIHPTLYQWFRMVVVVWLFLSLHDHYTPSSDGYFQQDNTPHPTGFLNMTLNSWSSNDFYSRSQSQRAPLGYHEAVESHHGCAASNSAVTTWYCRVSVEEYFQHLVEPMAQRTKAVLRAKGSKMIQAMYT